MPSPALIVALIALFVALSGVGYAAKRIGSGSIKKNAITASKIKRNAVTASKIKRNAVTTAKLKNDNVTGDKVLESSLGKVPDADKLDGQDAAAFESSSRYTRIATFSLGNGETRQIYALGPFTLTAKCEINSGGNDIAKILIASTLANSAFDGDATTEDLGPASLEVDREFAESTVATGTPLINQESDGSAVAPDGTQFVAQVWTGSNILNQANRCSFGGFVNQVS